jgi:tetratricopeptide (TPR) repeat protein
MDTIIEEGKTFSNSLVWKLQHNAYQLSGPRAWQISNNPYIARSYAWQTIATIRDWENELIKDEPLYIIEIGAGAGRFSFLYLLELKRLLPIDQPICLVISDNVDTYLEFWENHPKWKVWIEEGTLDFANYDPTRSSVCHLIKSNRTLSSPKNPIIAITNYFYAALPNDLYQFNQETLEAGYPILKSNGITAEHLEKEPKLMQEVEVSFEFRPVEQHLLYPDDPYFDDIIEEFRKAIAPNTPFLFPLEAMRTINNLKKLAQNRLMIISGDKAFHTPQELEKYCDHRPIITGQGDANVDVNGLALALYTDKLEGRSFHYPRPPRTDYKDVLFSNWVTLFGNKGAQTQDSFRSLFENGFSPLDAHKLIDKLLSGDDTFTIDQTLSFIKLSHFDPQMLFFYKSLNMKELFHSLEESTYKVQGEVMHNLAQHFFWIHSEDNEIGYLLAQGLYYALDFPLCQEILLDLITLSGESDQFRFFLGLSYKAEGRLEKAKEQFQKTLKLNPNHPLAQKHLT